MSSCLHRQRLSTVCCDRINSSRRMYWELQYRYTVQKNPGIFLLGEAMLRQLLPLALAPAVLFAAETIDGTWKADLSKIDLPTKVTIIDLEKGMYSCPNCVPV